MVKSINTNDNKIIKRGFIELVEEFSLESSKEQNAFIDMAGLIIKIKLEKIALENRKATLVSFIDSSLIEKLEKTKLECKNKTSLISTISHELRSPVNAILNTLELIEDVVPSDSINLLEMAKECCNMITSYINDFTVNV